MKKPILEYGIWIFALLFLGQTAQAQYGFGTTKPSKASIVEMRTDNKGLLIPRVALTGTEDFSPITGFSGTEAETNSLLVYNTATTTGANAVTPGFYYWVTSETRWKRIVTGDKLTVYTQGDGINIDGSNKISSVLGTSVESSEISDGTIVGNDLNQMSATSGQVLTWNGTTWGPAANTDNNTTNTSLTKTGTNLVLTDSEGNTVSVPLADIDTDTNTTNISLTQDGTNLILTDSDGGTVTLALADLQAVIDTDTDTNTTNISLTQDGTNLILTDSDGGTVTLALADLQAEIDTDTDTNTTNTSLTKTGTNLVLTDSEGNTVSVPLADIDTDTNTTYTAGTGITITGANNTIASTLGTSIESAEITNGSIAAIDIATAGNNQVLTTDGTGDPTWVSQTTLVQNNQTSDAMSITDGVVTHTEVDGGAQHFRIVRHGNGSPAVSNPVSGDMYVDDATGDIYTYNGTAWIQKTGKSPKFFYMPSVIFNTTQTGNGLTRDLYADYVNQFQGNTMNMADGVTDGMSYAGGLIGSTGSPAAIDVYDRNELYYYISYYDQSVFDIISIDADGLLTYNIKGNSTDLSYMTIIFVVK